MLMLHLAIWISLTNLSDKLRQIASCRRRNSKSPHHLNFALLIHSITIYKCLSNSAKQNFPDLSNRILSTFLTITVFYSLTQQNRLTKRLSLKIIFVFFLFFCYLLFANNFVMVMTKLEIQQKKKQEKKNRKAKRMKQSPVLYYLCMPIILVPAMIW